MRIATVSDVPKLVKMMAEFYSDWPYTLNPRRATEAFTSLLADDQRGYVWFIQSNGTDVGYVVITLCHSMAFGGLAAIVDDFLSSQSTAVPGWAGPLQRAGRREA